MLTRRSLVTSPALLLVLALALGCAAGQAATQDDAAAPQDGGGDRTTDAAWQLDGEPQTDAGGEAAAADAAQDAAPQSDAQHDVAPQHDANQDTGCPAGHTGVNCEDCVATLYKCDLQCVQSCASCTGKPATCSSPKACLTSCSSCSATCVDCPTGYHLCPAGCHPDGTDTIATGCRLTCDGQPCVPPAHATAVCTTGACDFTCDAAGHWIKSGAACVCDGAAGFVEDQGTCVCNAAANLKPCGTACLSTTVPANGCAGASCTACTAPAHGTAICDGSGNCDFTCDGTGHWLRSGAACVCDTGYKDCSGTCVGTGATATGCANPASCAACPDPGHASVFCDGGGACDFTCDTANHWVRNGATCICDSGYTEANGVCCLASACPGSMSNGHCYWYAAAAATFAAAEAACVSQCAHLVSITDAAENNYVLGLAATDIWIGLHDTSTERRSVTPDTCSSGVWVDPNGGTYTGDTWDANDNYAACNSSSYDVIFSLDVQKAGIWVFSTANSDFDTVLGLYARAGGSGSTGCVGSNLACSDDVVSGTTWSQIVRYLAVGQYVIIVDGYNSNYGNYSLDVRRFDWTDGTTNTWNNWKSKEPNNSSSNEYCVEMYKSSSAGQWNDMSCTSALPYVCERPF